MNPTLRRWVPLLLCVLHTLAAPRPVRAQAPPPAPTGGTYYVRVAYPGAQDADGYGTSWTHPWRSLTWAVAHVGPFARILVGSGVYTDTSAGGFETFPIRVDQPGIRIIGIPDGVERRPRLTVSSSTLSYAQDQALLEFRSPAGNILTGCAVRWVEFDNTGSTVHGPARLRSVAAFDVSGFDVTGCDFRDGYYGLWIENQAEQMGADVLVRQSSFAAFGPVNPVAGDPDLGEAGIVVNGHPATHLRVESSLFQDNHTGLLGGIDPVDAPTIEVVDTLFVANEYGIEVSDAALSVLDTTFRRNAAQRPPGGIFPAAGAGLRLLGTGSAFVRDSRFLGNAAGVLLEGLGGLGGPVDLGQAGDPGRNEFLAVPDRAHPDPAARSGLIVAVPGAFVTAVGNRWVAGVQGADAWGSYGNAQPPGCSPAPCQAPNPARCTQGAVGNLPTFCPDFFVAPLFPVVQDHANWALAPFAVVQVK